MHMMAISGFVAVFAAGVSANAVAAAEYENLVDCLLGNVTSLEPHQDNMLDLAEIIFTTTCEKEKKSFFNSRQQRDQETMEFHISMMKIVVQQMVVQSRADRLSIKLN